MATTNLQDRLSRLERHLQEQTTRVRRGSVLTAVLGTVIVVALCGYFYYAYTVIGPLTEPQNLTGAVETILRDNLPTARKELEKFIVQSSPSWAEQVSKMTKENIPVARQQIEDALMAQFETQMDDVSSKMKDQFSQFLKDNRKQLQDGVAGLSQHPPKSEEFLSTIMPLLEKQLGTSIKQEAETLLEIVYMLNSKLEDLKDNKSLSAADQHLREMLKKARGLADESLTPPTAPKRTVSTETIKKTG